MISAKSNYLWLVAIATSLLSISETNGREPERVNYESITFLNSDGHTYTRYTTTRSEQSQYEVFFDKTDTLDDYLYINPNQYEYKETDPRANVLRFDQGSYGLISVGDYVNHSQPELSLVTRDSDGIFTLQTWDRKKQGNGHYGFWNMPDNFTTFAIAWVLPDNFQIIEYHGNREGEWVRRGNTLTFFASDVNDLTFELRYRHVSQNTFTSVRDQLQNEQHVDVEQASDGIKVILGTEILFSSGSVTLSDEGQAVLQEIAASVIEDPTLEVIVEGHTDDITITGALADTYPTNWELSSKRALNVVHELSSAGLAPQRLQARAYGPFRPRVPNNSAENRRTNRRIELILRPLARD
ncbi:MAG: OmpA family protein [Pseudomonadota bacterium]